MPSAWGRLDSRGLPQSSSASIGSRTILTMLVACFEFPAGICRSQSNGLAYEFRLATARLRHKRNVIKGLLSKLVSHLRSIFIWTTADKMHGVPYHRTHRFTHHRFVEVS